MFREDREMLTELKRLCSEAPQFALNFMAGTLSVEDETSYGIRLAEVAGHARMRAQGIVEGQATVIDGLVDAVILEPVVRELPPGSQLDDNRV